jgi:hypothetical protein
MKARLLDVAPVAVGPRSTCRDLVALPRDACPVCGGPTVEQSAAQPALLRHGGYGETHVITARSCADQGCRFSRIVGTSSTRPDRRPA